MDKPDQTDIPVSWADVTIKFLNAYYLILRPRRFSNFRWANSLRDGVAFINEFAKGQYTTIYGRVTTRYNYHPQQQYENSPRHFDLTPSLASQMKTSGVLPFYEKVCNYSNVSQARNFYPDLTMISDISSATASADYVYNDVFAQRSISESEEDAKKAADLARHCYLRGYSRVISVTSLEDWDAFREEMGNNEHHGAGVEHDHDSVCLIAVSYKGNTVKITRRMKLLDEDNKPEDDSLTAHVEQEMTSDFADDFRWSQLIRSCIAIAKRTRCSGVRLWIDRLVMMGKSKEERNDIYDVLRWEDFGLFSYAVATVVRLYDRQEPYYGSDFWRKLETIMGVAGRGVVVDDYMLRKFDHTIYYGEDLYTRLDNGISMIGGKGLYVRSVTLALATAVLTDGVAVSEANEDGRTKSAVGAWKAWAMETIAEGAYSKSHSCMLRQITKFKLTRRHFETIAFWESNVSRCSALQGNSYLDMSFQKSMQRRMSSSWNGITEWVGMVGANYELDKDQEMEIRSFLNAHTDISLWVSTTGHVASIINLTSGNGLDKRSLVLDLSRYSTSTCGHVTAVAEATGLRGKSILPGYLRFDVDPDRDQVAEITNDGIEIHYKQMGAQYWWAHIMKKFGLFIIGAILILPVFISPSLIVVSLFYFAILVIVILINWRPWPWVDYCDVGEGLFDNLLLHSIYKSGIKSQYRRLKDVPYGDLGWY